MKKINPNRKSRPTPRRAGGASKKGWRIGVDIGGTFTDVVLSDGAGGIDVVKVPTTPRDFARAVLEALTAACSARGLAAGQVTWLAHATTIVTNALLEGKGARTALITTAGMRDVLELRRSARGSLYNLFQDGPADLVPRHLRLEVRERLDAQGQVVERLRVEDVDAAVDFIKRHKVEAVAVCLLFSFLNDAHERAIGERVRAALPDCAVFLSSEVLPEIREFERTSTTAVCGYVGPILASYLGRLDQAVTALGFPSPYVMASSGGVLTVAEAVRMPAMVVESGPAAGVIAAALVGDRLGIPNLISFDMGGTTAKASLIERGEIKTTSDYEVGGSGNVRRWLHGTGHPIRVPVIDLAEVSAGGGSIAWVDPAGALRVGPGSAGAEPGPVCYGQGGERPTVTDADLVLGYLNPVALLGGKLPVHLERARTAIDVQIARPLRLGVVEAASAIVDVVNAGMAAALRIVSVERGYDPREFALIAFGGAGPGHAARLADELEIATVIVPPIPGGFSALGLVASDFRRDYVRTFYTPLAAAKLDELAAAFESMEVMARAMLRAAGVAEDRWEISRAADLRYGRQAYELTTPVAAGPITVNTTARLAADFHDKHRMTFGHSNPDEGVQLVNIRVAAVGKIGGLDFSPGVRPTPSPEMPVARDVYFKETGLRPCEILSRDALAPGAGHAGPVIIEAMDTTIVVPPGWRCSVDALGFIILETTRHA